MEKILRLKFIKISVSVVFVVLLTIMVVLNVLSYSKVADDAEIIINILAQNEGDFPALMSSSGMGGFPSQRLPQEAQFSTRYFTIKVDQKNELLSVDTRNVHIVDTNKAIEYANSILNSSKIAGFEGYYRYQVVERDYGKIVIFVDCESELLLFQSFFISSIAICSIALLSVFILIIFVSKFAVAPIIQSYNKQQQFITDISHELKTPLAIIKTNTEVIECVSDSSSEWTESIHHQITRLTELVNYLISLSKMDEDESFKLKTDFSISDATYETAESFMVLAQGEQKEIACQIEPNHTCFGDEQSIRMLLSILVENAIKYSIENTEIFISLHEAKGKKVITVINEAENITEGNYDRLFERFYRLDNSRNSSTGGFGIGLAMAKTIVKNHGGTIKAESLDGKHMIFKVEI